MTEPIKLPDYLVSVCALLPSDSSIAAEFITFTSQLLSSRYRYYEIVVVDNRGSVAVYDKVAELQRTLPGIRVLRLSRRQPDDVAICCALDHSIGDFSIALNPVTDPIDKIPEFVSHMAEGSADVVMGQYRTEPRGERSRSLISGVAHRLAPAVLRVDIPARVRTFFGFSRRALNSLVRIRTKSRHLLFEAVSIGYGKIIVAYDLRPSSRWSKRPLFEAADDYVRLIVGNSVLPLRVAAFAALLTSGLNLLYLFYIFAVVLIRKNIVEGWLTMSLTHTVMFFILFAILAVITEYIGRILAESRDVPLYFIETETHSTASTYDNTRINVEYENSVGSSRPV